MCFKSSTYTLQEGQLMLNKVGSATHSLALLALNRVAANLLNPLTQRPPAPGWAVHCTALHRGKAGTIYIYCWFCTIGR